MPAAILSNGLTLSTDSCNQNAPSITQHLLAVAPGVNAYNPNMFTILETSNYSCQCWRCSISLNTNLLSASKRVSTIFFCSTRLSIQQPNLSLRKKRTLKVNVFVFFLHFVFFSSLLSTILIYSSLLLFYLRVSLTKHDKRAPFLELTMYAVLKVVLKFYTYHRIFSFIYS